MRVCLHIAILHIHELVKNGPIPALSEDETVVLSNASNRERKKLFLILSLLNTNKKHIVLRFANCFWSE